MDISEVLIEKKNKQTNAQLVAEMLATCLSLVVFSLSILHFTLLTFLFFSIMLCVSNQVEFNIITHLVHIVIIIIISLSSPPPPRQSVQSTQPSHPAKEDNKYIYKTVRNWKLS